MSKLVCSNCRRHKKRCDGEAPCQRCQAADIGASCSNHDDYRLILRRETTLQAALSTIVEPAIRFMFGTATSARQGHISVNRSMVQLMGAPYNMAMALHRATLGMPFIHPDDRQRFAVSMRAAYTSPSHRPDHSPMVHELRVLRPVWKQPKLTDRASMPIPLDGPAGSDHISPAHASMVALDSVTRRAQLLKEFADDARSDPLEGYTLSIDESSFQVAFIAAQAPHPSTEHKQQRHGTTTTPPSDHSSSPHAHPSSHSASSSGPPPSAHTPASSPAAASPASSSAAASPWKFSCDDSPFSSIATVASCSPHHTALTPDLEARHTAVYHALLKDLCLLEPSAPQQAALQYLEDRLAGFEVVAHRCVSFPEYDDAGVLQAETKYMLGWTVLNERMDVAYATSRYLKYMIDSEATEGGAGPV